MLGVAAVVGVVELVLAAYAVRLHRRAPFVGGPLIAFRFGVGLAAFSLACVAAAALLEIPASRGVALVALLMVLGWFAVRKLRAGNRGPAVHADAQRVQWKVRAAPHRPAPARAGYVSPSRTVQGIEGMEVQP